MPIREFLNGARRAEEIIESNIAELERLRELAFSLQSTGGGDRVRTSRRCEAGFTAVLEKIEQAEERLNEEIDAYVDRKDAIRREIDRLDNADERLCMRLRYLDFLGWDAIAERMSFSERQIYRIHDRAVAHMEGYSNGAAC